MISSGIWMMGRVGIVTCLCIPQTPTHCPLSTVSNEMNQRTLWESSDENLCENLSSLSSLSYLDFCRSVPPEFLRSFFAAFCGRLYQIYFFQLLRWDQRSLVSFISTRTNISLSSHPANINQISRQILCDHQRNQQCVWNNRFQYLPHIFVLINILWAFVSIFLIPINYLMA